MNFKLDDIDTEQLVAFEGCDYKVSNGNSGLQINIKTCPNCGRDDWKVYLNAETGLGNCFVCNVGYNKFKFVKLSRGFAENKDVFRYIESINDSVRYKPKKKFYDDNINRDWGLPSNIKMNFDALVIDYLKERNINAKICNRFDIRFCKYGFYKYKDFNDKTKFVDFSNRIIIPVFDIDGNMVTFQGRDITGRSERKYLFPNMLAGTGRYIYNAHNVIKAGFKKVVLNEGCFDVWSTVLALESNIKYNDYTACGTFGKHLSISATSLNTDDQLSDINKMWEQGVDEFIILWDGESEAYKAAIKAALHLNSLGYFTTVASLGCSKDPNEAKADEILKAIDERILPNALSLARLKLNEQN